MDEISDVFNEFKENYDKYINIISVSNELLAETDGKANIYGLEMHYYMLEKMFMNIFMQWEKFLEDSFILYMTGKPDMQGISYVRYAAPIDKSHAYNILKGTKKYPDWTNIHEVVMLAGLYFENLGAYSLLANIPPEFNEMKTVRNKISHMSSQADKQFKILVTQKLSNSEIHSAGEFLNSLNTGHISFFEYYVNQISGFANAVANTVM